MGMLNANPIHADDGSDRGPVQGLSRWAKASVGSGDRRRREACARGPSQTSFGRFGPDKGPSALQKLLSSMAGALEGLRECFIAGQRGRKGRATFAEARRASAARFSRPVASSGCGSD